MKALNPGLRPWVKGQSGNPGGVPSLPPELRAIKSLSVMEVRKLVSKYARMSKDEINLAMQSPATSMMELAVASVFVQSAKRGDYQRLAFLLDRAIGKAPVAVPDEEETGGLAALSDEELITVLRENVPQLKVS